MAIRPARIIVTGLRRAVYPLLALPLGVSCLALIVVGRTTTATSLQVGLLRRLLGLRVADPPRVRMVAHALVSLPLNILSFILAGYLWLLLPANLGYPLRPDTTTESVRDAWGGPTLAGAWAVHAVLGVLTFLVVGLPVLALVTWAQGRLARIMFGPAEAH